MPRFEEISAELSQVLKPPSAVQKVDAAVVLLLRYRHGELEVLLVERAKSSKDPWSGQMAFPGGKRDQKDRDMLQTAVRETLEETNIDLTREHRILGALESIRSSATPNLTVASFVMLMEGKPSIEMSEELVGHLWIRLSELRSCKGTVKLPSGEVTGYILEDRVVWGLTFRILEQLFAVLEA
jgi:8-oxo-dGTP pyrophosphatase MutT (NUDIX family)